MAGRARAGRTPKGSHSYTCPLREISSQLSHVPQGVGPPEQFRNVPCKMERESMMFPAASKRIIDAPPSGKPSSAFET